MMRMTKVGVFVSAAVLTLCAAGTGRAQQPQRAQPRSGPPSQAQIAASPAAERLKELLQVVNTGDAAKMRAYTLANGVDPTKPGVSAAMLPLMGSVLNVYRRTKGLDLVRVDTVSDSSAMAIVRDRVTGEEESLTVKVEPQAPHRIVNAMLTPPPSGAMATPVSTALSESAQVREIGTYLKRLGDADIFSGVVVIARDGKPVFSHAYGYADRAKKIPNTTATPFLLGSMNKLFTGLAIGQLVEQGKLSYDDPLSKFVPDFPDPESAKRIKIKHLLSHTSGLGDFFSPTYFESLDRLRTVQSVLDVAPKDPPKFEPGTSWSYSNIGFQLLGRVIEIVTGDDYYDYMAKNVFAPAGMRGTSFPNYDRDLIAFAHPYEIEFDGSSIHLADQMEMAPRRGGPAGDGLSTAPDLIKLAKALDDGHVVKPETFRLHSSPKPQLASLDYGYGFMTEAREAKRPFVGHGGNAPGRCTEFGELRDTPYTIAVLSNVTFSTCMTVTGKILRVLAPTKAPAQAA